MCSHARVTLRLVSTPLHSARSRRYPSRGRPRELDLSGSRDNPTESHVGAVPCREQRKKENGGKKETSENRGERGRTFFSHPSFVRSSRFLLSGPNSRNRHKSRRFIICGGRHVGDTIGWRELAVATPRFEQQRVASD